MRLNRVRDIALNWGLDLPTFQDIHKAVLRYNPTTNRLSLGGTAAWADIPTTTDLTAYSQALQLGPFTPPGFQATSLAGVTTATGNQTIARYLGPAPKALTSVVIRAEVATAYVAGGTAWAEIGVATSPLFTVGGSATLTRAGFTNVASTFNATGRISTTVAVTIAAGSHVWALWGSQASAGTIFDVTAGIGDAVGSGKLQFKAATRISTFTAATVFAATSTAANDAWLEAQWS